jgi:hypothetical protein
LTESGISGEDYVGLIKGSSGRRRPTGLEGRDGNSRSAGETGRIATAAWCSDSGF